jgi:hypothetical protein
VFLSLTEDYIASKFFLNCGKPFYNKGQKVYQGSCPICHEGKSWLKKRRCYYIVKKNVICCHNCGWYSSPYQWIAKVCNLSYGDIKRELEDFETPTINYENSGKQSVTVQTIQPSLPEDSINITDDNQLEYFKQNTVIKTALQVLKTRKLSQAINKPKHFFVSLSDRTHLNRLIIPFYDLDNKIIFYQTRSMLEDDPRPKYLSKIGAEKSLYGVSNIDVDLPYLFLTEGPIDSMFIQNGIGIAGINSNSDTNFTSLQEQQLKGFPFHDKVWVLDNQFIDKTSKEKTKKLLENNENVFLWPESLKNYKDVNEVCVAENKNCFDYEFIIKNTFTGLKGKLLLKDY